MQVKLSQVRKQIQQTLSEGPLGDFPTGESLKKMSPQAEPATVEVFRDYFKDTAETWDVHMVGEISEDALETLTGVATAKIMPINGLLLPVAEAQQLFPTVRIVPGHHTILISARPFPGTVNHHVPEWLVHDVGHVIQDGLIEVEPEVMNLPESLLEMIVSWLRSDPAAVQRFAKKKHVDMADKHHHRYIGQSLIKQLMPGRLDLADFDWQAELWQIYLRTGQIKLNLGLVPDEVRETMETHIQQLIRHTLTYLQHYVVLIHSTEE